MPKISVIIPVYNTEKYLSECLNSVLAQTLSDIEIICINDGSTDDSAKILSEYLERDNRIKIINQKNSGVVVARNNGITQATADLIYPLDSDDIIAPNALEEMYSVITNTNFRVVGCECQTFGKNHNYFCQPKFSKFHMYGLHENCIISALFYKVDFMRFGMYKIAFNGYGGDDIDYWLNYIDNDLPMYRIPKILFFYRTKADSESVWKNYSDETFKIRRETKEKLLRQYHPKMSKWVFLYWLAHCKIARFLFRSPTNDKGVKVFKIFKIPFYRKNLGYKLLSNTDVLKYKK